MLDQRKILLTGGSGVLGTALRRLLPELDAPSETDFDVTRSEQMEAYLEQRAIACILHAAAFVSPPLVEKDPLRALEVNIIGTANVVRLCMKHGLRLVYISTDYVFRGDQGNYAEEDSVHPVNKYAWSKLGGECCARLYDKALIIRTTFGPDIFPYPRAFADQWTSREPVSRIAALIVPVLETDLTGVLHVGGPRKSVHEYATGLDPARPIAPLRRCEVDFDVPEDTSLNTARYEALFSKGTPS
ncbi:MAG TPA: sugar nucleotide-binding protein [Candidatus Hydrogenedentes bacterium]|nr:sugar nucleotide-binding protein [Candidatus Hydrogenedentota bacterium]HNT86939.1 sugar nucleotide-binding protein [Candidatus Hydrogenedentota bacterium]